MKYRALRSFSGLINMRRGEEREISNEYIAEDLLKAGYIEELGVPGSSDEVNNVEEQKEDTAEDSAESSENDVECTDDSADEEKTEDKPKNKAKAKEKKASK